MSKFVKRWKNMVRPTNLPGVWELKQGGFIVRARVVVPCGKTEEIRKVLPDLTDVQAFEWLREEREKRAGGRSSAHAQKTLFSDYAVSLLEKKLLKGQIKSARGAERWKHTLTHLIKGTKGVQGFGDIPVADLTYRTVERWVLGLAQLVKDGRYAPSTVNGWINILKVVMKAARRDLDLKQNAVEGIEVLDTSEHSTYSEEEPNSLTIAEARRFLSLLHDHYPQHYAFICLGFTTGLRPSSLRPLRRSGPTPDIRWDDRVLLVRRSHTMGQAIMNATKTGLKQRITLPADLIEVLRWHVETQLVTPEQDASELLFPREDGLLRSESALKKAFEGVSSLMGLKKRITPRAMRRTFNDLARAAQVEGLVTKSISGHLTDRMKDHYSTVSPTEQSESIGKVLRLVRSA